MKQTLRATTLALSVLAAALPLAAHAGASVYESASFVDESVSGGDFYIDSSRYLGAVFTVTATESLTAIGGNFTLYGDGNSIFGAIVPVVGGALPGDVASTAVAETLFTPAGGEQSAAISGVLTPGTYAVVFGSGLFGATGSSGLVSGQAALGAPSFVQYGGDGSLTASAFGDDTLRMTVSATTVPEPASALMIAFGLFALGMSSRLRRR
jgi:hypothetical protein